VGKLADIAVIEGDVLADIRISEKVSHTVVNGRVFDAETMDEIGNHPRTRPALFWELDESARPGTQEGPGERCAH
jgi:hypothetical protein